MSLVVGLGPSYQSSSPGCWVRTDCRGKKEKQAHGPTTSLVDLEGRARYRKEVEDYVKKTSFQPINPIPLLLVGYTF